MMDFHALSPIPTADITTTTNNIVCKYHILELDATINEYKSCLIEPDPNIEDENHKT